MNSGDIQEKMQELNAQIVKTDREANAKKTALYKKLIRLEANLQVAHKKELGFCVGDMFSLSEEVADIIFDKNKEDKSASREILVFRFRGFSIKYIKTDDMTATISSMSKLWDVNGIPLDAIKRCKGYRR